MLSVERLYDQIALLVDERQTQIHVSRSLLPQQVREGDLLEKTDDGYRINDPATQQKKHQNFERLQRLSGKNRVDQNK